MSTESAVTSVTPTASGRAPRGSKTNGSTPAPVVAHGAKTAPAKKGRPAFVLKGGVSYKDAKATAKDAIRATKHDVQKARTELKERQKLMKADTAAAAKAEKALNAANVALAKAPKDAAAKSAVATAKLALKNAQGQVKASQKDIDAQAKVVAKLDKAWVGAQETLNKLEAAKLASLNS